MLSTFVVRPLLFNVAFLLLLSLLSVAPQAWAQVVTSTQMVGPAMPRPHVKAMAPPVKAKSNTSSPMGEMTGVLKGFFKNTGRTVPEKEPSRKALAERQSNPVVVGSPSSGKPVQTIDMNDFMKLNPNRELPTADQLKAEQAAPVYVTAPTVVETPVEKLAPLSSPTMAMPNAAPNPRASGFQAPQSAVQRPSLLSPLPPMTPEISETQMSTENPPKMTATRIDAKDNPLGIAVARQRVDKVHKLMQAKNHTDAKADLFVLRQWLIEATEGHVALYKTLNDLPSGRVQAEFEKQLALEFAKLRDTILYDTARYYVWTSQPNKAVKELVEVVQSQSRSDLGLQAYELLQTIGFTEQLQFTN